MPLKKKKRQIINLGEKIKLFKIISSKLIDKMSIILYVTRHEKKLQKCENNVYNNTFENVANV